MKQSSSHFGCIVSSGSKIMICSKRVKILGRGKKSDKAQSLASNYSDLFLRKLEPWTSRTMWLDRRDAVDPRQSYLDICTFFSLHIFYSK